MITFSAIANFVSRIEVLRSVRRGVYATVEDEVSAAFRGVSIEQIRQNYDMILMDSERIVIKLRLPDKKHRLSKKDGYRLIYLVYKDREEVAEYRTAVLRVRDRREHGSVPDAGAHARSRCRRRPALRGRHCHSDLESDQ